MAGLSRRQVVSGMAGLGALSACSGLSSGSFNPRPQLFFLGAARVQTIDPETGLRKVLLDRSPADGSFPKGVIYDGIAVHSVSGQIFWTDMGRPSERDGSILRCERDGSGLTTIVAPGGAFTPKQMRIDEAAQKIYWSDREGMAVRRCNLDGTDIETLVMTGNPVTDRGDETRWCVGLALDPSRGHIYWTQKGGDNASQGVIRRVGMVMPRGSSPANRADMITLFSRLPEPIDLDLDLSSRTLYWTDRGDNTVSSAPLDPRPGFDPAVRVDRTILLRDLKEAVGIALDLPRRRLAYTSLGGEIGVAGLDGSSPRMLATDLGMLTGVCWA